MSNINQIAIQSKLLQKYLVIGKLLHKYYDEGKTQEFKELAATINSNYVYAYSLLADADKNPSSYENGLNSNYYVEISRYINNVNDLIAKLLIVIPKTVQGTTLFNRLFEKYKDCLTKEDFGNLIIRLYYTRDYDIAKNIINGHIQQISTTHLAKIAMLELSKENIDTDLLKTLITNCVDTISTDLKAQLLIKLLLRDDINYRYEDLLMSNDVLDAMVPLVIKDAGNLSGNFLSILQERVDTYHTRLIANVMLYSKYKSDLDVGLVNFLNNQVEITKLFSNLPSSNEPEAVLAKIKQLFVIPKLYQSNLYGSVFAEEEAIEVIEHSLDLCNRYLNINDRDSFYDILFNSFYLYVCNFSQIINEDQLLELFENAEKKYNNHTLGYFAKVVNHHLDIYYKSTQQYELTETGKALFAKTGYYMAKNLENTSLDHIKTIWPAPEKDYSLHENCDFRTYLAISRALDIDDVKTAENIFNVFDAEVSPTMVAGFMVFNVIDGLEQKKTDYIFSFIKNLPVNQQENYWQKVFEVLDCNDINDNKINLLTRFFNDTEISDKSKSCVFNILKEKHQVIKKLLSCDYISSTLAKIVSDPQNLDHVSIVDWINNENDSQLEEIAVLNIGKTSKVSSLKPRVFAHFINKNEINNIQNKVREYFEAHNNTEAKYKVANTLVSLKASSKLEYLCKANHMNVGIDDQASLLINAIATGDQATINTLTNFIVKSNKLKENYYDIWGLLACLFRMITFTMPDKTERLGEQIARLYMGQEKSVLTFAPLSNLVQTGNLEEPQAVLDILSHALIYFKKKKDMKALEALSNICESIIEKHPTSDYNKTFKRIGYDDLRALVGTKSQVNKQFQEKAYQFTQSAYKNMSWVERTLLHKAPEQIQVN